MTRLRSSPESTTLPVKDVRPKVSALGKEEGMPLPEPALAAAAPSASGRRPVPTRSMRLRPLMLDSSGARPVESPASPPGSLGGRASVPPQLLPALCS